MVLLYHTRVDRHEGQRRGVTCLWPQSWYGSQSSKSKQIKWVSSDSHMAALLTFQLWTHQANTFVSLNFVLKKPQKLSLGKKTVSCSAHEMCLM